MASFSHLGYFPNFISYRDPENSDLIVAKNQTMLNNSEQNCENIGNLVETSGNPPKQTKLRQQIGYVFFEGGNPQIRQNAWHNYTLLDVCRNGIPIKATIAT